MIDLIYKLDERVHDVCNFSTSLANKTFHPELISLEGMSLLTTNVINAASFRVLHKPTTEVSSILISFAEHGFLYYCDWLLKRKRP